MDVAAHNRRAWNQLVSSGDRWTIPVSSEAIDAARRGRWAIVLTPTKPVPRAWFDDLHAARVLCLACGGGQQAPILAAAGADVTVLDNSPAQLEQDRTVAEREGLSLRLELGQMDDLDRFADASFDLIFHPVSNLFVADVRPVWREAARVLRAGGNLLAGFANPAAFIFDADAEDEGRLEVRYALPYSDLTALPPERLERQLQRSEPLVFGHSLTDQVAGQLDVGLTITGFYEDGQPGRRMLDPIMPLFIATRARKL